MYGGLLRLERDSFREQETLEGKRREKDFPTLTDPQETPKKGKPQNVHLLTKVAIISLGIQ